jgi:iron complex transport system ATP-binding protein
MTLLNARQLSVRIGAKEICQDLNLTLRPGETWGILGPNGCGKSTLLHTLAGLHAPGSGNIFLHGQEITHLPAKTIAQSLGILFQDTNIAFPQTVWDYSLAARYPHRAYFSKESSRDRELTIHALRQLELDHLLHRNILQLSGGEKRRLAIAALLIQAPDIYLLDEPSNHLDVRHQSIVLNIFRSLTKNSSAVMMSLHDANLAQRFCNQILLLFPDGGSMQGASRDMLTTTHLSRLYQHEMCAIKQANLTYWIPAP